MNCTGQCNYIIFTGGISYFCWIFCLYWRYYKYIAPNNLFVNFSGRITANHSGSGLLNSWSWNSSNFHVDDVLDSSYTNQEHKPLYSLDNFPSNELNVITIFCTILRLKSVCSEDQNWLPLPVPLRLGENGPSGCVKSINQNLTCNCICTTYNYAERGHSTNLSCVQ